MTQLAAFTAAYSALVRCRCAQEIQTEPIKDSSGGEACCTTTKIPDCLELAFAEYSIV
jgi:hypothetical protein